MKKLCVCIFIMLFSVVVYSQELPKVIPPSPNASAFHVYGNTEVNHYTGAPNIQIPIYTIKEGDLTLPIYLKYTGGNGIKVEEEASWVGLGWTLNTGGAISRTIRGIADDVLSKGFLSLNTIPNYNDFLIQPLIQSNKIDTEPDSFMYSYPGGSGSFSYDITNNFQSKPKDDIIIDYTIGTEIPPSIPNPNNLIFNSSIVSFALKDTSGNLFTFKDKERSNTRPLLANLIDKSSYPSSWYLSKIQNLNRTKEINLRYDSFYYSLIRKSSSFSPGYSNEDETFTKTEYLGKRLKDITFSQGKVEFIESVNNRKDLSGNKYLDKILVKDKFGNLIKEVRFFYKYMSPNGLLDINLSTTIYEKSDLRLVLDKIQEVDKNGQTKPAHKFGYYNTHYLPNKYSKSVDHWGYFNGANNIKFEPKQYITYYDQVNTNNWKTFYTGSADRNSKSIYGKSGILKTIEYPTGGKTDFGYESHEVISNDISGDLSSSNITLNRNGSEFVNYQDFDIQIHSNPVPLSKIRLKQGLFVNPTNCNLKIHVKELPNGEEKTILIPNQGRGLGLPSQNQEIFFGIGSYRAWFTLESNTISCPNTATAIVTLEWDNEDSNINKQVGGLRVKNINNYSSLNTLTSSTNFEYIDSLGNSSGSLVTIPVYYGITLAKGFRGSTLVPLYYKKFLNSMLPLSSTKGSNVGYGKVTVKKIDNLNLAKNGKSEYYYTTSNDYPDTFNGIDPLTGGNLLNVYSGRKFNVFPQVEADSKDFIRGLLVKEIQYSGDESSYSKVYEKNITYDINRYTPLGVVPNYPIFMSRGLKYNSDPLAGSYKVLYYDLYSGYGLESTIKETFSFNSNPLKSTTYNKFLKNDDFITQYNIPIEKKYIDSRGVTNKVEVDYIFNKTNKTFVEQDLYTNNALYISLKRESFKNTSKLSEQNTIYKNFNGLYLPEKVQVSKGSQSMEDRIVYHSYDDKGNPVEVSKKDGSKIYYVWGYDKTQPIAKIEGYTSISPTQLSHINQAISASNSDDSRCLDSENCTEKTLRDKLKILRNSFSSPVQVTSFTYDPLIGVTSITDPRGDTIYYHYDSFNRLEYVKDAQGNVLSKNEYNYKN